MILRALTSAGRWYMDALEGMGRSIEAVPGWRHVEGVLDAVAEAFALGVVLSWALRWWFALMFVALLVVST